MIGDVGILLLRYLRSLSSAHGKRSEMTSRCAAFVLIVTEQSMCDPLAATEQRSERYLLFTISNLDAVQRVLSPIPASPGREREFEAPTFPVRHSVDIVKVLTISRLR